MALVPPPVDSRDFAALVRDTRLAVRAALGLDAPPPGVDAPVPGDGLVHIFARLAEIVVDRLNAVPDKNLLAFLGLVGVERHPPVPAQVPLTFRLAQGATRALVPASTTVAAVPAAGEADAPVYETEAELVLTAAEPVAAFTRRPALDRYGDATAITTDAGMPVPAFDGTLPVQHEVLIADPLFALAQPKDVTLRLGPLDPGHRWPDALRWSRFDGAEWQPLSPVTTPDPTGAEWRLTFPALPGVVPATVGGLEGAWLRARLASPLPPPASGIDPPLDTVRQDGLAADAAFADDEPLDPTARLFPFGDATPRRTFSIACERAFSKPGAGVELTVAVDASRPPTPAAVLTLAWSYASAAGWTPLGASSPAGGADPQGAAGFVDGTQAFTRDGSITFAAPPDWSETTVGGIPGFWLQVAVSAGDFGSPPAYAGPALDRISVSYAWPLPRVEQLSRQLAITRRGLKPEAALFGAALLDLSKDFQPFGEKPRFNDVVYLACDEALSLPDARVILELSGTKAVSAAGDPVIVWEVYDADQGWTPARVEYDTTAALTFADGLSAQVVLRAPADPSPLTLGGLEHYWLRARLVGGGFGADATFTTTTSAGQTTITPVPASWDPPSIRSLEIGYDLDTGPGVPETVATLNDFRMLAVQTPFAPFTFAEDALPTVYLGLSTPPANETTMLFFQIPDTTDASPARNGGADVEPASVAWEYRSPDGWRPLGTKDGTRGFTVRGLVAFIAPADLAASSEFDRTAYWLRARWERGGYPTPPRLARVLTNTVWASHVATIRDEVLGSGTGDEGQSVRTARTPVLPGQQVHVRELGPPSAVELAAILAEEGDDAVTVTPATVAAPAETWVRWHETPDFYGSGPRSRHYVVDRLAGEIRFGDGRRGLALPEGRGNVRALYRTGGGSVGNRPPGAITQLKTAVPYVDGATNLEAAVGGADAEPLETVRERGPRLLRHANRAVTIADVEDLAAEASPEVARVLGVPATGAGDAGGVGVVVVPDNEERRPVPSVELLERVRAAVAAALPATAALWVSGPGWLEIAVTAEVVPVSLEQAADVQGAVRSALEAFLHPLVGGPQGQGWPFGRTPRRSDLLALIERQPGVDHVRGLAVAQAQTVPAPADGALLVYSADHTITMTATESGAQ